MKQKAVYFGYDQNGLFKIGMTESGVEKRIKQIQNMNPSFGIMFLIETNNPRKLEAELHSRFASKRIVGEWFKLSADEIQSVIFEFNGVDVPIEEIENNWNFYIGQDLF